MLSLGDIVSIKTEQYSLIFMVIASNVSEDSTSYNLLDLKSGHCAFNFNNFYSIEALEKFILSKKINMTKIKKEQCIQRELKIGS